MKKLIFITILLFVSYNIFADTAQESIEKANKAGQAVFLIITEPGNANTQKAIDIANQAREKASKTQVIQADRSDAANIEFIAKYTVQGVPLPMILVIASNGVVAGAFYLSQASPEVLVKAIPSPARADVLKALSKDKSVFLVVSSKNMAKKDEVMNTCQQACIEMQNNAKLIALDLDDPGEKQFISDLKIDTSITSPQTYVINSGGKITGTFGDDVSPTTLVATAKKLPAAKGCSKSCQSGASGGEKK